MGYVPVLALICYLSLILRIVYFLFFGLISTPPDLEGSLLRPQPPQNPS